MAVLIDNDNTAVTASWYVGGDGTNIRRVANSFQLTDSGNLNVTGATFRAGLNTGASFTFRVRIETNNSGVPSGSLANAGLTGTVAGTGSGGSNLHTVTFDAAVDLSVNTTYWLVVQKDSEATTDNKYDNWMSTANPYAGGQLAYYTSSTWTAEAGQDMFFQILGGPTSTTTSTSSSTSTSTTSTSTSTSTTSTSSSTSTTSTSSSTSTTSTSTSSSSSTSTSTTSTSTSSSTSSSTSTTSTSSSTSSSTSTSTTTTWIYPFIVDSGLASNQAEMSFKVDPEEDKSFTVDTGV